MVSVSVIVPAYKASRTMRRTVESVMVQTLKDIEIIIVDDGSPDIAGAIADDMATMDSRIRVIHQPNRGCYEARLAGFAAAKGKYVTSVDADDFIEDKMLERMLNFAEEYQLKVVECDFAGNMPKDPEMWRGKESVWDNVTKPRLLRGNGYMCVCGKLYRNDINWESFSHCKVTAFEDIIFNAQIFGSIDSYGIIHEPLYHYETNEGSSARCFKMDNLTGLYTAIRIRRANGFGSFRWNINNGLNMLKLAVRSVTK